MLTFTLTESMQTALIDGCHKRWKKEISLQEVVSMLLNGEIFIFDKKGLFDFYVEADLNPIPCLKEDIKAGAVIASDNLFFLIEV